MSKNSKGRAWSVLRKAGALALALMVGMVVLTGCGNSAAQTETKFLTALFTSDTLPEGEVCDYTANPEPWKSGWMVEQFPDATENARKWLADEGIFAYGLFPAYEGEEFVTWYNATYQLKPEKVELTENEQKGADEYRVTLNVTGSPDYTRVVVKGRIQLNDDGKVDFVAIDGIYDEQGSKLMYTLLSLNSDKAEPAK